LFLRSFPLSRVYQLLEPGPVVMVTTFHRGRSNVMTMSWHTMMDFEPPLVGCVIGSAGFTFERLRRSKQCVIAVPTVEMASRVVGVGNCSGRDMDKFEKFGLKTRPASQVKAPLLPQCYANLECVVEDASWAGKYNFFVLRVLKAWVDPSRKNPRTLHHRGFGAFRVAGGTIKLPSKMR
jgi:flavin reductase (DIM6/NTAB) family NADH-FMN oxidoreductase RutF